MSQSATEALEQVLEITQAAVGAADAGVLTVSELTITLERRQELMQDLHRCDDVRSRANIERIDGVRALDERLASWCEAKDAEFREAFAGLRQGPERGSASEHPHIVSESA